MQKRAKVSPDVQALRDSAVLVMCQLNFQTAAPFERDTRRLAQTLVRAGYMCRTRARCAAPSGYWPTHMPVYRIKSPR